MGRQKPSLDLPRVVTVGSNLESTAALGRLLDAGANVVGAVAAGPRVARRTSDISDITPLCESMGVRIILTDDINDASTTLSISEISPDFIYVLGWSQVLGRPILDIPTHHVVGSHPSPLPMGKGRAPIPWTILTGLTHSAVSLFVMDAEVDNGNILSSTWFAVPEHAYAQDVYRLASDALSTAYTDLNRSHNRGEVPEGRPQVEIGGRVTHWGRRTPADGLIDFAKPTADVYRLIRAVSHPYPGAYSYHTDSRVIVWRASIADVPEVEGEPGLVVRLARDSVLVKTADAAIWLTEMTTGDLTPLALQDIAVGSRFGYRTQDEIHEARKRLRRLETLAWGGDP